MNQHLDTIPIWDSLRAGGECFLCNLQRRTESQYIDSMLGGAVMEPEQRIEMNAKGFCARHNQQMMDLQNRLGLALITHTRLKQLMQELEADYTQTLAATEDEASRPVVAQIVTKKALPSKKRLSIATLSQRSRARVTNCLVCERLNHTMQRYYVTVIEMWLKEKDFQKAFAESTGCCVEHYGILVDLARQRMVGANLRLFIQTLIGLQRASFTRLEKELEWFTLKFDYRNAQADWGTSRDALPRAIQKMLGPVLREEKKAEG